MTFKEWNEEITNKLVELGFDKNYAKAKTIIVKGCYFDRNNYSSIECAVKMVVKRASLELLSDSERRFCRKMYLS